MDIREEGPTLVLCGHFDGRSTEQVRSVLGQRLAAPGEQEIVIDLSGVPSVDVPALRVLAYASREAHRGGHHVLLRGCTRQVVRMLLLTRLIRFVDLDRGAA